MTSKSTYVFQADVVRALAAIGVVALHAFDPVYLRPDFFGGGVWWLTHLLVIVLRSAVPIFVIMSGYLNLGRDRTFIETWNKTLYRIIIPLIVFYAVLSSHDLFTQRVPWEGWGTIITFYNRFNINTQSLLYFLIILVFLYLLTPFFNVLFQESRRVQRWYIGGFLALGAVMQIATISTFAGDEFTYNTYTTWMSYIGYYLAGYYIRHWQPSKQALFWAGLLLMGSWLTAVFGSFFSLVHADYLRQYILVDQNTYFANYLSIPIILQSLTLFVLVIKSRLLRQLQQYTWLANTTRTLAQNSYGIFLVHIPVMYALNFRVDTFFSKNLVVFLVLHTVALLLISLTISIALRKTSLKIILGEGKSLATPAT